MIERLQDVLYFLRQIFFPNWTDREDVTEPTGWRKLLAFVFLFLSSRNGTGTVFSIVLHVFILVVLSLIMMSPPLGNVMGIDILGDWHVPGIESDAVVIAPEPEGDNGQQNVVQETEQANASDTNTPTEPQTNPNVATTPLPYPTTDAWKINTVGGFASRRATGGGFQNRNTAGRQGAISSGGSSQGSERAVEAALAWLAYHQDKDDGGWSLHLGDCCGQCSHSGTSLTNRRTAATALALLSFFGAGYSHNVESRYKDVVEKGLWFLIKDPNGGIDGAAIQRDDLRMYSYGLAAMALCEAYAMNRVQDPTSELGRAAQKALWLLEDYQGADGGWRYRKNYGDGDTSVFAWQLMALKSGKIGGLNVSQPVLYAAQNFLDSVALEGGREYQYLSSGEWDRIRGEDSPKTCTAIGLLMRMYLGWKPGDPALDDGMNTLVRWTYQPRAGEVNLYYAYYATLALHHYGGNHWDAWNSGLHELLIRTQSHEGCESGSWYFSDRYCDVGGRLLNTALAVMILETPYRFMPLYREIR